MIIMEKNVRLQKEFAITVEPLNKGEVGSYIGQCSFWRVSTIN